MLDINKQMEYLTISFTHDYYRRDIPISLTLRCKDIIRRYGLYFLQRANSFVLIGKSFLYEKFKEEFKMIYVFHDGITKAFNKKMLLGIEEDCLRVYLQVASSSFYFVTALGDEVEIETRDSRINPLAKLENKLELSFHFNGVRKHIEYIFTSEKKYENLEVVEENGLLLFNKKIISPFVSDKYMTSFSTSTTVPISEVFSYKINLIEQNQYGVKIIKTGLNPPAPSSFSPNKPKNTISKYYTL